MNKLLSTLKACSLETIYENPDQPKQPDWVMKIVTAFENLTITVYDKNKNVYRKQNGSPSNNIDYWYIPMDGGTINIESINYKKLYTSEYLKENGITVLTVK